MKKILKICGILLGTILLGLIIFILVPMKTIDYLYISSPNGKSHITLVRYLEHGKEGNDGYYILNGRIKKQDKLPETNYIKIDSHTFPLWINFKNDGTVHILYGMGNVLENRLLEHRIKIDNFYGKADFDLLVGDEKNRYKEVLINLLQEE